MKKAFISALIVISLLTSLFCTSAFAAEADTVYQEGNFEYTVIEGPKGEECASISGYNGNEASVSIPQSIGGYPVTQIGEFAFYYHDEITEISIPDGITHIGNGAFLYCPSLTEINLPGSVTHIGIEAFRACYSLTKINLPDSVTHIGDMAFLECFYLEEVFIPGSVVSIGAGSFARSSLSKINLSPDNKAFELIDGVLYSIEEKMLLCCPPDAGLHSVQIKPGTTSIGDLAFAYCGSLDEIYIPDSVTHIGDYAFEWCSMNEITIPASVASMGSNPFVECSFYRGINLSPDNKDFELIDDVLYGKENKNLICCFNDGDSVHIKPGTNSIDDKAFYFKINLREITLPESITHIGRLAFYKCKALETVRLSDGISYIGDQAFYFCDSLTLAVEEDSYAASWAEENGVPCVSAVDYPEQDVDYPEQDMDYKEPENPSVFRGVEFGMTREQVEDIESKLEYINRFEAEESDEVFYIVNNIIKNRTITVVYTFEGENDGVSQISIFDDFGTMSLYEELVAVVSEQYGEPKTAEVNSGIPGNENIDYYSEWRTESCDIQGHGKSGLLGYGCSIDFTKPGTMKSVVELVEP